MVYDFLNGETATRIKELTKSEIQQTSNYYFEPIADINYSNLKRFDNRFFYVKSNDAYLMFAYKKKYNTLYSGIRKLPVYHVCECKTKEEYSGFNYTSSMPVEIYCKDERKLLDKPKQLKLCSNCVSASQKGLYGLLARGKPWYEYVLQYASSNSEFAIKTQLNGYVLLWKQISEAVRERVGFKCEDCSIDLSNEKYFLEVHHIDYNKQNNKIENLKALCVLCHANVDNWHLQNYQVASNRFKVNSYIDAFSEYISNRNKHNLEKWNNL